MPEYLAPGVYVEETSFRAKSIEGVSTSTAGFVGPARFGLTAGIPELVTSFAEYQRKFGGDEQMSFDGESELSHNYLAHGIRSFFENGGRRVYVSRVYEAPAAPAATTALGTLATSLGVDASRFAGYASASLDGGTGERLTLVSRFPGASEIRVTFTFHVSEDILGRETDPIDPNLKHPVLKSIGSNEVVWLEGVGSFPNALDTTGTLYWAERYFDDTSNRYRWVLHPEGDDGTDETVAGRIEVDADLTVGTDTVRRVSVTVETSFLDNKGVGVRTEGWENLPLHPAHRRSLSQIFAPELPGREQQLSVPFVLYTTLPDDTVLTGPAIARMLLDSLNSATASPPTDVSSTVRRADGKRTLFTINGGSDGLRPAADVYKGTATDPKNKTGLEALADVPDISIIAAPGYSVPSPDMDFEEARGRALTIMSYLIGHCERVRYSIAVLDSMENQALSEVRQLRAQVDSTRAALYYPFVRVLDPVTDREIVLPPSGFVAGIYARNDIEHGVHKAPANEVVRGAIGFEFGINKEQQDVLNPENINVLRYFEGRGYRLWGARTTTSDPEWKYVNVRRYFLFLERSIDRGTQWAVFENNGEALWANIRRTIEDFLFNEWNSGHLLGSKPDEAFFVRCDRTTMTQNDLDNGRMVCLIGVAPLRPAEFVIFRIGQKTADTRG